MSPEPKLSGEERKLVDRFSDMYYRKQNEGDGLYTILLSWMGYQLAKCPLDLWIYQELIVRQKPDLIIEIGTYKGGSAMYLANMCDLVGNGRIISIDIDETHAPERPVHPRIEFWTGSSIDPAMVDKVRSAAAGIENVLVILDGDHHYETVLDELRQYSSLVPVGGYIIVEDSNINGHPTYPSFGPGPWEAVEQFMQGNDKFVIDKTCERFMLTMNPNGYLKRLT